MSRTFVTTSSSAVKLFALFGPTSCSAKVICSCRGSGTFEKNEGSFEPAFVTNELRKKTKVCSKKTKMHLDKTQSHWRVCLPSFVFTSWCIRLRFLAKQTHCILAFALHLYRFSHGQSYFSFSKKIYWSRMGSRMGSKIGFRFGVQKGVSVLSTPAKYM